jgi:SAM-dependent methyltransferase
MREVVPQLFDPVKAERAEVRARRIGAEMFLLERATEDLLERLAPVLREFSEILDIGTPDGAFGRAFAASRTAGRVTRLPEVEPLPAEALPTASQALILSGMTFHRINDLPGLLSRIRRALKPDGLLIAAFPGGDTLTELREVLLAAESEARGAAGLRVFPMIDVRAAGQLLQRAGFALPVVDSERLTLRYDHLFALIRDLRAMGASATSLVRSGQPGLTRGIIARAAALYAERHADPDGRIRATIEIIWMSGWAPHESQQKPLQPGSAKARLADALETFRNHRKR